MDNLTVHCEFDHVSGSWISWPCAVCGEPSPLFIDPQALTCGGIIEDCTVCCRPNRIEVLGSQEGMVTLSISDDS